MWYILFIGNANVTNLLFLIAYPKNKLFSLFDAHVIMKYVEKVWKPRSYRR